MTFTSAIGRFIFSDRITLSKAKLIRDTVMGQFLIPTNGERLTNSYKCREFAQKNFGDDGMQLLKVELNKPEIKRRKKKLAGADS